MRKYTKPTLNIEEVSLINVVTTSNFEGFTPLTGDVEVNFNEWDEFFN